MPTREALVLLAVFLAGKNKGATLEKVIEAADYVDKAALSFEEARQALEALRSAGYIRYATDLFVPTGKAMKLRTKLSGSGGGVRADWESLSASMSKEKTP